MSIDAKNFRIVAGGLVLALLLILVAMTVLAGIAVATDHEVSYPGVFDNILTGLITGLFGLLVNARSEEPVDVKVTNTPVETVDAPPAAKRKRRSDRGDIGVVGAIVLLILVAIAVRLLV